MTIELVEQIALLQYTVYLTGKSPGLMVIRGMPSLCYHMLQIVHCVYPTNSPIQHLLPHRYKDA